MNPRIKLTFYLLFRYAVIFTGGIVPTAWRPITSYGALDLPNYFVDLTPFVPLLTDGKPHLFSIDVVSAENDHAINQNWFVSGAIHIRTDSSSRPTTGRITNYVADPFALGTESGNVAPNGDINITVGATRFVKIESEITSGSGKRTNVVFTQNLTYSNTQVYAQDLAIQVCTCT